MCDVSTIPGLTELWDQTRGDDRVRVAMVDGPVDLGHPAFAGASVRRLDGVWSAEGFDGPAARHGTHVASVIFGQQDGPVQGISPDCSGLSLPAFSDRRRKTSQLEIARAVELAVEAGAHIINISGGQLSPSGAAEDLLDRAVRLCRERNVLVVAAAGNDGCFCDHVPAALPSVLAVGALDDSGQPLAMSNWGPAYADQGILASGENILGAVPGGATTTASGTSMAAPIVAGVAALLLSMQLQAGQRPDPLGVRAALLASAEPCPLQDPDACKRFLTGKLDIRRAMSAVQASSSQLVDAPIDAVAQSCGCGGSRPEEAMQPCSCGGSRPEEAGAVTVRSSAENGPGGADVAVPVLATASGSVPVRTIPAATAKPAQVSLSQPSAEPVQVTSHPLVYALGTLGYDFGTEARRDSFKQSMKWVPPVPPSGGDDDEGRGPLVPPNPYDARQMADHLAGRPDEARALIWTLNIELNPVYAIEPAGSYGADIYKRLVDLLTGEVADEHSTEYIERVSIPGRLTGRSIRLFTGQVIPVVEVGRLHGMHGWKVNKLIEGAIAVAKKLSEKWTPEAEGRLRDALREFLNRIYYDLRNLGATSRDRALNFAATNVVQAAGVFDAELKNKRQLDTINVEKSPFCRLDSDCWDVKLHFFDPENTNRARHVYRYTIDVSDIVPVTLGQPRDWSER